MIIVNGFIKVAKATTQGGLDADGYPVEPTIEYGCPICCQWLPTRHNKLATSNGEPVTSATYTILLQLPVTPLLAGEKIALYDKCQTLLGEYSVISCEVLRAVGQVKVVV